MGSFVTLEYHLDTILVVIDALDESGEARSREQILRMLAGNVDPLSTELHNETSGTLPRSHHFSST